MPEAPEFEVGVRNKIHTENVMRVVMLGKPGSGKGTQAKRLAARLSIPAISTGDLIRSAVSTGSELGVKFASYSSRGLLVPDELVLELVRVRMAQGDCQRGFVLDGFPRTVAQADELGALLGRQGVSLDRAMYLEVEDQILVERASGRRYCPRDGRGYHVTFAPAKIVGICDECGGDLAQRDDDRVEVVQARLKEYDLKTAPLLGYYARTGIRRDVVGVGTPEEVEARLFASLNGVMKNV